MYIFVYLFFRDGELTHLPSDSNRTEMACGKESVKASTA